MGVEHETNQTVCLDDLVERSTGRNLSRSGEGELIGQLHDAILEPAFGGNRLGCETEDCERTCVLIAKEGQLAVRQATREGECIKLAPRLGLVATL